MKIYSYYGDVPDLNRFDELKLSILWRERWEACGFEPVILNEWHARKHPMFEELSRAVENLPTSNPKAYERHCFIRWLALAHVGGGYMSDLDVMPSMVEWNPMTYYGPPYAIKVFQAACCPAVVHAMPEKIEAFCAKVLTGIGNAPQNGRSHYSDQYALAELVDNRDPLVSVHDVVKLWSDVGWESAPMVHFATAVMQPKGLVPKWKHIPQLLKV